MKDPTRWLPLAVALLLRVSAVQSDACSDDLDIGSDVSVSAGCSTDSLTLSYTATIPSKYLHGEINIEYQCDNSSKQILQNLSRMVYTSHTVSLSSATFQSGNHCTFSGCYTLIRQRGFSSYTMTFTIAPYTCIIDDDECTTGEHMCSNHATCTDILGGYNCSCVSGYYGDGFLCLPEFDECANGTHYCDSQAACTDTKEGYYCTCLSGFQGDGFSCMNMMECENATLHSCHEHATCIDTVGSYYCDCVPGYSGDGLNCTNIDECAGDSHSCDGNAACLDSEGSYSCVCNHGYAGNGTACRNIIECENATLYSCNEHATCIDTVGSYSCDCVPGYSGDGLNCTNVDECAGDSHECDNNAECLDSEGSYTCICNSGYTGNGTVCRNIIECENATLHSCHEHATCIDTTGSYFCYCNPGYSGDALNCTNVDECAGDSHECDNNAECFDSEGSYTCICNNGYTGNGTVCRNVVECENATLHSCNEHATCIDTVGSYSCDCVLGYSGDGLNCTNVDECAGDSHGCDVHAECIDSEGSYTCVCSHDYTGNGTVCRTIDIQWEIGVGVSGGFLLTLIATTITVLLCCAIKRMPRKHISQPYHFLYVDWSKQPVDFNFSPVDPAKTPWPSMWSIDSFKKPQLGNTILPTTPCVSTVQDGSVSGSAESSSEEGMEHRDASALTSLVVSDCETLAPRSSTFSDTHECSSSLTPPPGEPACSSQEFKTVAESETIDSDNDRNKHQAGEIARVTLPQVCDSTRDGSDCIQSEIHVIYRLQPLLLDECSSRFSLPDSEGYVLSSNESSSSGVLDSNNLPSSYSVPAGV